MPVAFQSQYVYVYHDEHAEAQASADSAEQRNQTTLTKKIPPFHCRNQHILTTLLCSLYLI